jgi:hypothetical protein
MRFFSSRIDSPIQIQSKSSLLLFKSLKKSLYADVPWNEESLSEFDTLSQEWNLLVLDSADDVWKITPEDNESV